LVVDDLVYEVEVGVWCGSWLVCCVVYFVVVGVWLVFEGELFELCVVSLWFFYVWFNLWLRCCDG